MVTLEEIGLRVVPWQRGPGDRAGEPGLDWPTASPGDAGLDGRALEALADRVRRGEVPNVHAVVVVRNGRLAFERYFTGPDARWAEPLGDVEFGPDTLHDARSVTKSVVGALVGIAWGDGALADLDAPIAGFFPNRVAGREQDLAGRTLRHALTMSAGLEWDETTHPYWDPRNDEHGMWAADDPLLYALSRRPVGPPGTAFAYNGGLPTVLAAVVEQVTGVPLDVFARQRLWCPLGVTRSEWIQHRSNRFVAASGLRLTPRDLARFGQLMLDEGRCGGQQIVPADYAAASLSAQVDTGDGPDAGYGYQWWVGPFPVAVGNGGQRVLLDRQRRMVVVVTAGNYDTAEQQASDLVLEAVLDAAR